MNWFESEETWRQYVGNQAMTYNKENIKYPNKRAKYAHNTYYNVKKVNYMAFNDAFKGVFDVERMRSLDNELINCIYQNYNNHYTWFDKLNQLFQANTGFSLVKYTTGGGFNLGLAFMKNMTMNKTLIILMLICIGIAVIMFVLPSLKDNSAAVPVGIAFSFIAALFLLGLVNEKKNSYMKKR